MGARRCRPGLRRERRPGRSRAAPLDTARSTQRRSDVRDRKRSRVHGPACRWVGRRHLPLDAVIRRLQVKFLFLSLSLSSTTSARARVWCATAVRHGRGPPVPDPGAAPRRAHPLPPLHHAHRLRHRAPRRRRVYIPRSRRRPPPRHRPLRRLALIRPHLSRRRAVSLGIRAPPPPGRQGWVRLPPQRGRLQGRPEEDQQFRRLPRHQRPPPSPRQRRAPPRGMEGRGRGPPAREARRGIHQEKGKGGGPRQRGLNC